MSTPSTPRPHVELERERVLDEERPVVPPPEQLEDWLVYLIVVGLVTGGLIALAAARELPIRRLALLR